MAEFLIASQYSDRYGITNCQKEKVKIDALKINVERHFKKEGGLEELNELSGFTISTLELILTKGFETAKETMARRAEMEMQAKPNMCEEENWMSLLEKAAKERAMTRKYVHHQFST